jgi:hypothetical protein
MNYSSSTASSFLRLSKTSTTTFVGLRETSKPKSFLSFTINQAAPESTTAKLQLIQQSTSLKSFSGNNKNLSFNSNSFHNSISNSAAARPYFDSNFKITFFKKALFYLFVFHNFLNFFFQFNFC